MTFSIKNWKLTLLGLFCVCLLTALGFWQLSRAQQKERLLKAYQARIKQPPLDETALAAVNTRRFYRIKLQGKFDNQHTFLLDNKIYHSKLGYEVYTPFYIEGQAQSILIDRGFVPLGSGRQTLPVIQSVPGKTTLIGVLDLPPAYVVLGKMYEKNSLSWPLRVEYIHLATFSSLLKRTLLPSIIHIDPQHSAAYAVEWQIATLPPEKHRGYAVQWFALALTLLILSIRLNNNHAPKQP